jgi:hypothetical protein
MFGRKLAGTAVAIAFDFGSGVILLDVGRPKWKSWLK